MPRQPFHPIHPAHLLAIAAALLVLLAAPSGPAAAQETAAPAAAVADASTSKVLHACYVPATGTVYRIREPGLRQECAGPRNGPNQHVAFSWTEGVPDHVHANLDGLDADDHPQYLRADGSRALSGDLSAAGHTITGLGAASAAGEAVRFEQAVKSGDGAAGDLAGSYPAPSVVGIQGQAVSGDAPTSGQVLMFSGGAWAPATPAASGISFADLLDLDGAGSGLDADRLDGQEGSAYAQQSHDHDDDYAAIAHDHDARYYTEAESDARYVPRDAALTSPNGLYSLAVTDAGIVLAGPEGEVRIDGSGVEVVTTGARPVVITGPASSLQLGFNATLTSAFEIDLVATSTLDLEGSVLLLNGNCNLNARVGDNITGSSSGGSVSGVIATGSGTVFSC